MIQCVKKLLSDSLGINQGYLPASKKSFLSQLLWILNFKVKFSTSQPIFGFKTYFKKKESNLIFTTCLLTLLCNFSISTIKMSMKRKQ